MGVIAVTAILVFAVMPRENVTISKKAISIGSLSAATSADRIAMSMFLKDSNNLETESSGNLSYVLTDDHGNTVFKDEFEVNASQFAPISIDGSSHQGISWEIGFASLPQLTPTQNLTLTVTFRAPSGGDTKSTSMPLPSALKHLSPLYYEVGEPREFASMFDKGEVQAAMVYEPYASNLIQSGYGKAWLWSKDIWPGHPYYVLSFNRQWAEANPDLAKRMLKVHEIATEWVNKAKSNQQSQEYSQLVQMAKSVLDWNDSVLSSAMNNIQYKSGMSDSAMKYYENFTNGYLGEGLILNPMISNLGYSSSGDFIQKEVNRTLVAESQDVRESDTILGTVRLGFVAANIHQMARAVAMNTSLWGGKTLYERYGLNVVSPEPNGYASSGSVMGIGFGQNQIDAGYLGACSTILDRTNYGINAFIAGEVSSEGTALIVNSSLNGFPELSNETVASPGPNTVQHLMLIDLSEKEWFDLQKKARAA